MRHSLPLLLLLAGCQSFGPLEPIAELFQREQPVEPPAPLPEIRPEVEAVVLWHRTFPKEPRFPGLSPVFEESGRLYAATQSGRLEVLDLATGKLLAHRALPFSFTSGPTLQGESLYLAAEDRLVAVDKETLQERWQAEASGMVLAPPAASGEAVALLCADGVVELFDHEGKRLWHDRQAPPPLALRGDPSPLFLGDGTLLVAFADGTLARYEVASGRLLWKRRVALASGAGEVERIVDINETPTLSEGVAFFSAYYGGVAAVSLADGEPIWTRPDIVSATAPALSFPFLFVSDVRGDLWALDTETGRGYWKQEALHRRELTAPVVVGGLVAVGDFEGYLHLLTREEGRLVGRIRAAQGPLEKLIPVGRVGLLALSRKGELALVGIRRSPNP